MFSNNLKFLNVRYKVQNQSIYIYNPIIKSLTLVLKDLDKGIEYIFPLTSNVKKFTFNHVYRKNVLQTSKIKDT